MSKPIIGIVTKHFLKNSTRADMYVRDEVKQALFDNGAVAIGILLPKDEVRRVNNDWDDNFAPGERENLIAQIKLCDGIVLQGGSACDNYEMIVAKYCYDNDIPILGICAGQNVLVRALGGATYRIPNPKDHQSEALYVHGMKVVVPSKFYDIVGVHEMQVNSRHVKAIHTSPLLDQVAFCDDNYVEAVEAKDKKFYLGVKFHPESLYKIDDKMNRIFTSFIEACKK